MMDPSLALQTLIGDRLAAEPLVTAFVDPVNIRAGAIRPDNLPAIVISPARVTVLELSGYSGDLSYYFDEMGMKAPEFENDNGPEAFSEDVFPKEVLHEIFPDLSHGSLRRAEFMVGSLKEAAGVIATTVNIYKRNEIKARLAEIEASDLSDAQTKKAALKEATRLNKMLDQLNKQVRYTLPQWKVTG